MSTTPDDVEAPAVEPAILELATVRERALAFLLDAVVVSAASFALANRSERSLPFRVVAFGLFGAVGGLCYHVLLEGVLGRTVGKAAVGIVVVAEDGSRCTIRAATTRTMLRFVDWLPVAYVLGLLRIRYTARRQRVGDAVAETLVVRAN